MVSLFYFLFWASLSTDSSLLLLVLYYLYGCPLYAWNNCPESPRSVDNPPEGITLRNPVSRAFLCLSPPHKRVGGA